jgi:hypothetical protein
MKPGHRDWFYQPSVVGDPTQRSLDELRPPEIVGEVANPVLEAVRRLSWRVFDLICYCFVSLQLSIHDRLFGPEGSEPRDLKCETDQAEASQKSFRFSMR